jgi:hypothetical protein
MASEERVKRAAVPRNAVVPNMNIATVVAVALLSLSLMHLHTAW